MAAPKLLTYTSLLVVLLTLGCCGRTFNNHWCPRECDCFQSVTQVDCSKKGLHSVPQEFSNLTMRLYLEMNAISYLPPDAFVSTPDVVELHLQENTLSSEVSTDAFCGLQKLKVLDLSKNRISGFSVSASVATDRCQAKQLVELIISHNVISQIPANLSDFAPNLKILNLKDNNIDVPTFDPSYSALRSLRNIDLSLNHIHVILAKDFAALKGIQLDQVDLSDCGLTSIEPEAFAGMENLTSLSLAQSMLDPETLPELFRQLGNSSQLTRLDLSQTLLPHLTTRILGSFHQLVILDMSNCGVQTVEEGVFTQLRSLETLDLKDNELSTLDNLDVLRLLRNLHVRNNKLQEVDLRRLEQLEFIDLSANRITRLPPLWLNATNMVKVINVSHNSIEAIDRQTFDRVQVHSLDLSHNALKQLHSFGHLKLRNLYLADNQLDSITFDAFDSLVSTLEELDLSRNHFSHFSDDTFEDFVALQRLSLGHNRLGSAFLTHDLGQLFGSLSRLQVLDLCYNDIVSLPHEHMRHLHHLTTLNLEGNQIQDLADLSLEDIHSLAKLTVSNNRLSQVEPRVLSSLGFLEVVDLSRNPYDCSCALLPFLSWLNTTLVEVLNIEDPRSYICTFPPKLHSSSILSYRPSSEECSKPPKPSAQKDLTIALISVACVLVALAIVAVVFYFGQICHQIKDLHYRWQVRYREVSGVEIATDPRV